jgi:cell division protein FtsN
MAKDFAQITTRKAPKRRAHKKHKDSGLHPWVWLCSGIALGVGMVLLIFAGQRLDLNDVSAVAKPESVQTETAIHEPIEVQRGPRFDFHRRLPKMEVTLPNIVREPLREQTPARDEPKKASSDSERVHYFLQVGAFKHFRDADRRRGHLALLGLDADIVRVTTANGENWHRVHIGPIDDPAELSNIQRRLKANQIESMALK